MSEDMDEGVELPEETILEIMGKVSKPKPCPFCGRFALYVDEFGDGLPVGTISNRVSCSDHRCMPHDSYVPADRWQSRPIEDALQARIAELESQLAEATHCDLCEQPAGYHLCQSHLDDLRGPDVFSTADADYPEKGKMVLWSFENETYIGGYDPNEGWFDQGEIDGDYETGQVKWCLLPSLDYLYEFQRRKGEG